MKIIIYISITLLLFGCSNLNKSIENPSLVNLVVQHDKYSLILKHHFYKNFKSYDKNSVKFTVKTDLSFNTSDVLSNNGGDKLSIIKGTIYFKILNNLNTKIIKSGRITSSINTGSISSLYGIDKNNNFAKERISKNLAYKLYRKILLNINYSES